MLRICRYFHSGHFVYQFLNKYFLSYNIFCSQDHNSYDVSSLRESPAPREQEARKIFENSKTFPAPCLQPMILMESLKASGKSVSYYFSRILLKNLCPVTNAVVEHMHVRWLLLKTSQATLKLDGDHALNFELCSK